MYAFIYLLLLHLVPIVLLFPINIEGIAEAENGGSIGAILHCSSRVGKEERVAMEVAIRHLNKHQNKKLILHVKCSHGGPLQAALSARYLINRRQVEVIVGPNSWEESSAVAEVGQQHEVPVMSLCDSTPPWAATRWPLLVQASPSTSSQMRAVAAIIVSWKWRKVKVMYEEAGNSASSDILNHLYQALRDANVELNGVISFRSQLLREEMEKLKTGECRVFVVHTSVALAERIFRMAKEMKMMEKGYVWITTHTITSMVHSMNASIISDMEGVVGVTRFYSDTRGEFHKFNHEFMLTFRQKYPDERNQEPGIFGLQAYDAVLAVGSALNNPDRKKTLEKIQETDFNGLSGRIRLDHDRKLEAEERFQIINVIGKSYRELGFWSDGLGFSTDTKSYNSSMEVLGHVFWPGGPPSAPRGWDLPTVSTPMRIGVPDGSLLQKFIIVKYDNLTNYAEISGFSIEVFNKTVEMLNYFLPFQFVPFSGKYDDLVKRVQTKEFDAAVGDINIISSRYNYVEFTHAYTESGLVMVVPIERGTTSRDWLFLKPFTKGMWLLTVLITVYNGFVIWSIEKDYCSDLKGSLLTQTTTLIWLAFTTLFSLHGGRLRSNLSKMATVVWLFVALIITQSYTASLTSMLTIQNIQPMTANLERLKSQNAYVGCNGRSFVRDYLVNALQVNPNNIKDFKTAEEFSDALRSAQISAAFLEAPDAKLFVAKYCKTFIIAGPTYKVGGYGFAFPKGSQLLHDINKALLSVFESGELKNLEDSLMASQKCEDIQAEKDIASLSPQSFFVPFIFTGATSTLALAIYYFRTKLMPIDDSMPHHKGIWYLISLVLIKWRNQRNRFSRKVSDVEFN